MSTIEQLPPQLRDKIAVCPRTGCWHWTGARRDGYGVVRIAGVLMNAHRAVYEFFNGRTPTGLQYDHLCHDRACSNPDHVEQVTSAENTQYGCSVMAMRANQTHCLRGHPFDATNTYRARRQRRCRACDAKRRKQSTS